MAQTRHPLQTLCLLTGLTLSLSGCAVVQSAYDNKTESECEGYSQTSDPNLPQCEPYREGGR